MQLCNGQYQKRAALASRLSITEHPRTSTLPRSPNSGQCAGISFYPFCVHQLTVVVTAFPRILLYTHKFIRYLMFLHSLEQLEECYIIQSIKGINSLSIRAVLLRNISSDKVFYFILE